MSGIEPDLAHWYVFPWGGGVELSAVVGVAVEQDRLRLQLRRGGYLPCPRWTDVDAIAAHLLETLTKLEGVHVTVYRPAP